MNYIETLKRLIIYIVGLAFLSLGVIFSIKAGLGVSPVASLAYAISLISNLSIGATTILTNVLYIFIQAILNKRIDLREFTFQLIISFLFGFFLNTMLFITQFFPDPETIVTRFIYLIISLFIISIGVFGYFTAKLPLMPYDALTNVVSELFKLKFGRAKSISDLTNVCVAGVICLISIHSLGSIGIGTLVAAYFIGKIAGWMMTRYQLFLQGWINTTSFERKLGSKLEQEK